MVQANLVTQSLGLRSRRGSTAEELETKHARRASRAFFGCGNGGRFFDELNISEAYHAETDIEREERRFGFVLPAFENEQPEKGRSALTTEGKRQKRKRHQQNKKEKESSWRKEQQSKW